MNDYRRRQTEATYSNRYIPATVQNVHVATIIHLKKTSSLEIEMYDAVYNQWKNTKKIVIGASVCGLLVHNGKVFAMGGGEMFHDPERFSDDENKSRVQFKNVSRLLQFFIWTSASDSFYYSDRCGPMI